MPLKVIVVGAGIAGLCAATALRQAGHHVEVCFKGYMAFLSSFGLANCILIIIIIIILLLLQSVGKGIDAPS